MNNAIVAAKNQTRGELSELSQPAAKSEWLWIASIYMLLVISGAIRYWRDWQFQSLSRENETSPFPLRELPKVLGRWHMAEGSEKTLEADIARIAGANDYVEWNYVDEASGESVTVMVLYGLAHRVWPHVPDTCYPANGFKPASPPSDLDIPIPGTTTKAR
ncbi:MAG: exosortase-associated EpsI family protein, partial [Planctomycetaceae bacterium]|nr:exosortase-associated EpsI family protein [Planctomycetaceae bacterium]